MQSADTDVVNEATPSNPVVATAASDGVPTSAPPSDASGARSDDGAHSSSQSPTGVGAAPSNVPGTPGAAATAGSGNGKVTRNLFVSGVGPAIGDQQLFDLCRPFGTPRSCKVMLDIYTGKSRGFGFVLFDTEEEAIRAKRGLHNKILEGRRLCIEFSKHDASHMLEHVPNIYVRNIPIATDKEQILEVLGRYGEIENIDYVSHGTTATHRVVYVQYTTCEAAEKAVQGLHNTIPWANCDIPVMARLAEPPKQRAERKGRLMREAPAGGAAAAGGSRGGAPAQQHAFQHHHHHHHHHAFLGAPGAPQPGAPRFITTQALPAGTPITGFHFGPPPQSLAGGQPGHAVYATFGPPLHGMPFQHHHHHHQQQQQQQFVFQPTFVPLPPGHHHQLHHQHHQIHAFHPQQQPQPAPPAPQQQQQQQQQPVGSGRDPSLQGPNDHGAAQPPWFFSQGPPQLQQQHQQQQQQQLPQVSQNQHFAFAQHSQGGPGAPTQFFFPTPFTSEGGIPRPGVASNQGANQTIGRPPQQIVLTGGFDGSQGNGVIGRN